MSYQFLGILIQEFGLLATWHQTLLCVSTACGPQWKIRTFLRHSSAHIRLVCSSSLGMHSRSSSGQGLWVCLHPLDVVLLWMSQGCANARDTHKFWCDLPFSYFIRMRKLFWRIRSIYGAHQGYSFALQIVEWQSIGALFMVVRCLISPIAFITASQHRTFANPQIQHIIYRSMSIVCNLTLLLIHYTTYSQCSPRSSTMNTRFNIQCFLLNN